MRIAAFLLMCALAVVSVIEARLGIGLALGGAKAVLIGVGYMELNQAARAHMAIFIAAVVVITTVLLLLLA